MHTKLNFDEILKQIYFEYLQLLAMGTSMVIPISKMIGEIKIHDIQSYIKIDEDVKKKIL